MKIVVGFAGIKQMADGYVNKIWMSSGLTKYFAFMCGGNSFKKEDRGGVIIRCPLIPKGICVNLFGTFWARDTSWIDRYVVNHERIHTAQQRELLFVPFYILYVIEWLVRLVCYRNHHKAYINISFEREAYANGRNLEYLRRRRPYAWLKFL